MVVDGPRPIFGASIVRGFGAFPTYTGLEGGYLYTGSFAGLVAMASDSSER